MAIYRNVRMLTTLFTRFWTQPLQNHILFSDFCDNQQPTTARSVDMAVTPEIRSSASSEYVARAISDYLTSETGITIIFESAIVPKWKDSRISFKNVYVIRGPQGPETVRRRKDAMSHVGHKVAVGYDLSNHPSFHRVGEDEEDDNPTVPPDEDLNYTIFDLSVDSIVRSGYGEMHDTPGCRTHEGTYEQHPSVLISRCERYRNGLDHYHC